MTTLKEKTKQGFVFHRMDFGGLHEYKKGDEGFLYNPQTDKITFEYTEEIMEASKW